MTSGNLTSLDATPSTAQTTFSADNYLFFAILSGIIAESAISGIVRTVIESNRRLNLAVVSKSQRWRCSKIWIPGLLMHVFNFWCIVYMITFNAVWDLHESYCVMGMFGINFASHCFYTSFDSFILYKTFAISGFDPKIRVGIVFIIIYRFVWTVFDLKESGGLWISEADTCVYNQHPMTGVGSNSADILCDAFATLVSLAYTWNQLQYASSALERVVVQENVIRSAIVLSVNLYGVYISYSSTSTFALQTFFLIQSYTYAAALNSEHFWRRQRTPNTRINLQIQVAKKSSNQIASTNSRQMSIIHENQS
ncbi:hypothetical protein BDR26DRAFT_865779 [Obelidium mucronatum]|nr:hypothetical protein BDR26DRAFT_865779 [Obelidium mucronatum]